MQNKKKLDIEILGFGCRSCKALYELTQETVHSMGLAEMATVRKVENMERMMELNIMASPGFAVNNRLISAEKVYKRKELETLLLKEISD